MATTIITKKGIINILQGMIRYGRNQADLAEELGVSKSHLSEVLRGLKDPGDKIAEALKLQAVYVKTSNWNRKKS